MKPQDGPMSIATFALLCVFLLLPESSDTFELQFKDGQVEITFGGAFLMPRLTISVGLPKVLETFGLGKLLESLGSELIEKFTNITSGRSDGDNEVSCVRLAGKMANNGLPAVNTCLKNFYFSLWDFWNLPKKLQESVPCFFKCVGQKTSIFLEDGTIDYANVILVITTAVPDWMQGVLMKVAEPCMEQASGLQPNETTCDSHKPLINCFSSSLLKFSGEILDACPEIPKAFKTAVKGIRNATISLLG